MGKTENPPPLSPVQFEIMNVVWEHGQVTVSEVWKAFLEDRKISRGSVQTMIIRLEEKGWLEHREVGQAFLYSAVFPREASQGRFVAELVENAFAGSTEGLVWSLLDGRGISDAEAERLHEIIDRAKGRKRRKKS